MYNHSTHSTLKAYKFCKTNTTPEKAITGFKATGICPYNPDVFTEEDFEPVALQRTNSTDGCDGLATCEKHLEIVELSKAQYSDIEKSFHEIFPLPGPSKSKTIKLPRGKNKKTYREISSEDEDNDDECKDKDANGTDICLVCGEFGKNGEVWLRCNSCGNWAHKACTDIEKKLYLCDYCA
ncbi:hypothetical protein RN001_007681 [Aquatica leii]|uniref:PHD-type domain-containing protein n=1 Tax=Aquatica leii TaxID=1421715 RepID=A0AAN7P382_9COLE|nr:hypothetical protein RN001_007681 [Aquatica leii]